MFRVRSGKFTFAPALPLIFGRIFPLLWGGRNPVTYLMHSAYGVTPDECLLPAPLALNQEFVLFE
jgi:hypothetical protein